MLTPVSSGRFRRDVKVAEKRGKDTSKLRAVMTLPIEDRDHPLRGDWTGYRDQHIEPDWLLIYRIQGDELQSPAPDSLRLQSFKRRKIAIRDQMALMERSHSLAYA